MAIESTPSRNENEYFARVDAELRQALRARADAERAAALAEARNRCPRDGSAMESRTSGPVTIDQCPQCEGIWLDKGELEMLAAGNTEQTGFLGSVLRLFR